MFGIEIRCAVVERPQRPEVEDAAEVDVEGVGALAGEDLAAAGQVVHGLGGQRGVVRRAARPDVDRRAGAGPWPRTVFVSFPWIRVTV